jgi:hypothetical protein
MATVLESDETGSLTVPISALLKTPPRAEYTAQVQGNLLVIEPIIKGTQPFWKTASPQERAADILKWSLQNQDGPGLPDSAVGRDSIYE